MSDRRVGLEQEFFLVDESGLPSQWADEFLDRSREETGPDGPVCFAPEFVKGLVEVNAPPVHALAELECEYAENLWLAVDAARALGLRLYPLGTYPLPLRPVVRGGLDYRVQVRTVGPETFVDAGRCAGTHLHLDLPSGTVDADVGLVAGALADARDEVLSLHNLATALDPVLLALTRSCPYYQRRATGLAARTVHYRGSAAFGWEGVYTDLPQVGALLPHADDAEHLVRQQFDRYRAWLAAMDRAGVERHLFVEAGGDLLRPAWNPVRLNRQGTLELRGMDSNFSEVTLTVAALILGAADRVRRDNLEIVPDEGIDTFQADGSTLRVPGFGLLGGKLLYAAATGGVEDPGMVAYLDFIMELVFGDDRWLAGLRRHRCATGGYPTTEAVIFKDYAPDDGSLSEEKGLCLVLEACDELEAQVSRLRGLPHREGEPADVSKPPPRVYSRRMGKDRTVSRMDFGVRVGAVVERAGALLLVRHQKPDRDPYWVLPGGRLEPGETIPECAGREVAEETGLSARFAGILYVGEFLREGRHTVDIVVRMATEDDAETRLGSDPEVAPNSEPTLREVRWMDGEDLRGIQLLPASIKERLLKDAAARWPVAEVYLTSEHG